MTLATAGKRWLSVLGYGLVTRTLFGAETPPRTMRARFERWASASRQAMQKKFPGLEITSHTAARDGDGGTLAIESVCAVEAPRCALLHLHGGAFVMGSARTYRNRAMRMSFRCDAEVFVPEYRLAPEHPYPAALEDVLCAYRWLRAHRPRTPIIVTGDSAGGGLGLSLVVELRDRGEPPPAAAVLLSPWTDLSVSGRSVDENEGKDRWLSRRHLETWARYYAGETDRRAPLLSPLFADLKALPPLLLLAGEHEVLLDDAKRVVEIAARCGTDARLLVGSGMQHDWPLTLPWLTESRAAWRAIRSFVDEHTAPKTS